MFVFVEVKVALSLLIFHAEHAVGRGELGHDQAAAAEVADEAAEDRVGNARHGGEDCGGRDLDSAEGNGCGNRLQRRCLAGKSARATRAYRRIVPELLHGSYSTLPGKMKALARGARANFQALLQRNSYFLASSGLAGAGAFLAYLRRKRSTRPAVSMSFCLPVKKGWHAEQISTLRSPL